MIPILQTLLVLSSAKRNCCLRSAVIMATRRSSRLRSTCETPSAASAESKPWSSAELDDDSPCFSKKTAYEEAPAESSTISLESWLLHDHESFHFFSELEAVQIRTRLLDWYYRSRRKLPWRGDPPPWNGSTAGIGSTSTTASVSKLKGSKADRTKRNGKQPTLDAFFTTKSAPTPATALASSCSATAAPVPSPESSAVTVEAFPVTGYGVWVSEIMLQQTRVEAVIPYWVKWMKVFPNVQELAQATPEQVNAQWAGLGFYRRARLLHQAAQQVVTQYDGQIPTTVDALLTLPGIGRYTACAIASIAFNRTVPVVDGNVCRVLSRLRAIAQSVKAPALKDKWGWTLAAQLLVSPSIAQGDNATAAVSQDFKAGDVNQALMELGATYCSPSGSGLDPNDPLQDFYWSTQLGHHVMLVSDKSKLCDRSSVHAGKSCPICAPSGVAQVLDSMVSQLPVIDGKNSTTPSCLVQAKSCGHRAFPVAPDKSTKREDVLAVAVISLRRTSSTQQNDDNDEQELLWLMTRRLDSGLLAGQWEFPSALVWSSATKDFENKSSSSSASSPRSKKRQVTSDKVPKIAAGKRAKALTTLLDDLSSSAAGGTTSASTLRLSTTKRASIHPDDNPLEHIFSHVRHTMYVEHGHCQMITDDMEDDNANQSCSTSSTWSVPWTDRHGREVRWMTGADMKQVGVTSGVKKILQAVTSSSHFGGKKRVKRYDPSNP